MRSVLAEGGLTLAGRAGARLADIFSARAGRNTVLRLVDALPGHVNRIKMIKCQMYGRAGFGLLRKRVLPAS